jgi:hypothetical protein
MSACLDQSSGFPLTIQKRSEAEIRDHLASNLDLIETGLTLLKKEEHLPNDEGAAGFVDIFAQSSTGQLVIVEIKKSDAAARQAIQELSKYAALLKTKRLIKETEYRLIVASTHWHELHVPFSEFVHATRYQCAGYQINLGIDGLPISTELVPLLPAVETRRFSKRHFIWEFQSEVSARAGVKPIQDHMQSVGIVDFLIALVCLRSEVEGVTHLLYFAQQEKSFEEYMSLIKGRFSSDDVDEFEGWLSDIPEMEDKIGEAADKLWEDTDVLEDSLYDRVGSSGAQISHPEKARHWLDDEQAARIEIMRYGRLADSYLSDAQIITELRGDEGGSDYRASISANIQSKAELDELISVSDNLFFFNSVWRGAIRDLCLYAQRTNAKAVRLKAFSNDDILSTIAGLGIGVFDFVPGFHLEVDRETTIESYFGGVEWNARTPDYEQIVQDYFDGDEFSYFLMRHFGENRSVNEDILNELGLSYIVWSGDINSAKKVRIQGASIIEVRGTPPRNLKDFLEANEEFVRRTIGLFVKHDMSFSRRVEMIHEELAAHGEDRLDE